MALWLMKSEPDVFSIDHLKAKGVSHWDGVRNFQARNHMKAQRVGDRVFFYHSNAKPSGVVGIATVVREAYPDHTQFDPASEYYDPKSKPERPRWYMTDLQYESTFKRLVSLAELREVKGLESMVLLHRSRLSVQPVTQKEWDIIVKLGNS